MNRLRLLHLNCDFAAGSAQQRTLKLVNALGRQVEHAFAPAVPEGPGAGRAIDAQVAVSCLDDFPALGGMPFPRRLLRIAQAMPGHDLVLTYGWGAINAVLAHTLFAEALGLPPLVHHEDEPDGEEAGRLKPLRTWGRRIALARAQGLIVPSRQLEFIARQSWKQPRRMVHRIPDGIPVAAYARPCAPDALPRVIKRKGELWVGTPAGPHCAALLQAIVALPEEWQLVVLGDTAQRAVLRQQAIERGIGHRVHVPGLVPDPAKVLGLFDLFVPSADADPASTTVIEAMAAGLAIIAPRAAAESLVAPENRRFLAPAGDDAALVAALVELAGDSAARTAVDAANRARAAAEYDEAVMIAACRQVYAAALGRAALP